MTLGTNTLGLVATAGAVGRQTGNDLAGVDFECGSQPDEDLHVRASLGPLKPFNVIAAEAGQLRKLSRGEIAGSPQ